MWSEVLVPQGARSEILSNYDVMSINGLTDAGFTLPDSGGDAAGDQQGIQMKIEACPISGLFTRLDQSCSFAGACHHCSFGTTFGTSGSLR